MTTATPQPLAPSGSPRTDDEPFAFTRAEFLRGAGRAWLRTTLLLIAVWATATIGVGIVATFVILPSSAVAIVVGAPGAYAIGRRLRTSSRVRLHVTAFAAYGALLAVVVTAGYILTTATADLAALSASWWMFLVNVPVTAFGLANAWFATAKRAVPAAFAPPTSPGDADAAVEDDLDDRYRVIDPDPRRRQRPRA
ncbi:hypothetical protein PUW81_006215 [Microbacterium sp. NM3R9]|uniref:hypothetical protein n=1 Tax=Microbacterium thalli TaxID=3027921 RepID=UPI00236588C2|nr:hypothetical protein [Microbacterium thalli]MDD7930006.1 hypothetical protein [Microbacterium thalli]MDN8548696.1 hypothetical protein [Microbacterium thalli]